MGCRLSIAFTPGALRALASATALFSFFLLMTTPDGQGLGLMGLNFGAAMSVFALAANSAWELVAAWWYTHHAA